MQITIHSSEIAEPEALIKAVERVNRWGETGVAEIFCRPRVALDAPEYNMPGWLEYHIMIHMPNNRKYVIGMIQRSPGAEYEFHS